MKCKQILIVFSLLCVGPPAWSLPVFELIELDTLGGETTAWGVNDLGQTVGRAKSGVEWRAIRGESDGSVVDVGIGYSAPGYGEAINNLGQVVGSYAGWAFRTEIDGTFTDLGIRGFAIDINDSGQATGDLQRHHAPDSAVRFETDGTVTNLGTLGGLQSSARSINEFGQVTGRSDISGSTFHAFRTELDDSMTDLGTLGGTSSEGSGINDSGQVAGFSLVGRNSNEWHAFLTDADDAMVDLGTLGGTSSFGFDLNNYNEVVGSSEDSDGNRRAFYYEEGVGMLDLNELVVDLGAFSVLQLATGMSNTGFISGSGIVGSGETRGFLLRRVDVVPVPEPDSLALLLIGLIGIRSIATRETALAVDQVR